MRTVELRRKLIEQFNLCIQDDSKLMLLDSLFDSINTADSPSIVFGEHYKIVKERRVKRLSEETHGLGWEQVKLQLKNKYGF